VPAADAWDGLSPQELQIASMVTRGLTNREIGERLFLSHRTVGSHLYRMFPKLGISSRAELLQMAAERERA
jgi:DNA-binding CsgD family transcriptional regulator